MLLDEVSWEAGSTEQGLGHTQPWELAPFDEVGSLCNPCQIRTFSLLGLYTGLVIWPPCGSDENEVCTFDKHLQKCLGGQLHGCVTCAKKDPLLGFWLC